MGPAFDFPHENSTSRFPPIKDNRGSHYDRSVNSNLILNYTRGERSPCLEEGSVPCKEGIACESFDEDVKTRVQCISKLQSLKLMSNVNCEAVSRDLRAKFINT